MNLALPPASAQGPAPRTPLVVLGVVTAATLLGTGRLGDRAFATPVGIARKVVFSIVGRA